MISFLPFADSYRPSVHFYDRWNVLTNIASCLLAVLMSVCELYTTSWVRLLEKWSSLLNPFVLVLWSVNGYLQGPWLRVFITTCLDSYTPRIVRLVIQDYCNLEGCNTLQIVLCKSKSVSVYCCEFVTDCWRKLCNRTFVIYISRSSCVITCFQCNPLLLHLYHISVRLLVSFRMN